MDKFKLAKDELKKTCIHKPRSGCEQVFCVLHESEYLGSHSGNSHACLACTLNDSLDNIYKFLLSNRYSKNLEYTFTIYILLMYLLVEKLQTIFKIVGITHDYVESSWPILIEIRKWANFVKHPKGFLFAHHPEFIFEDDLVPKEKRRWKKITYSNFIDPLYKREDEIKFKRTIHEFANKSQLLVVIPNPERMARDLNNVCRKFCLIIKENPYFREILSKHTVLENY